MGSKQHYVIVGVIAMAAIVGMVLSNGFQWLWVQFEWDDPFLLDMRELAVSNVLGYCVAAGAGLFALKHRPTFGMANEVVDELAKVTWPSREETGGATVVVIVTVLLCAGVLGAFDAVWLALTDLVLGIGSATQ